MTNNHSSRAVRKVAIGVPVLLAAAAIAAQPSVAAYPVYPTAEGNCWPVGQTVPFNYSNPPVTGTSLWEFGDGATANSHWAEHVYATPGLKWVTLTSTDNNPYGFGTGVSTARFPLFVTHKGGVQPNCAIFRFDGLKFTGSTSSALRSVAGRVVLPDGTGIGGRRVGLRNPNGATVRLATSAPDGHFTLPKAHVSASGWTVALLDDRSFSQPDQRLPFEPRLHVLPPTNAVGPAVPLVVTGRLEPNLAGKLVQLQFQADGAWRPVVQTVTTNNGRFSLKYRFRRTGARYSVRMRAAIPRGGGWIGHPIASRAFTVRVVG